MFEKFENLYSVSNNITLRSDNSHFWLHKHDYYEIFLFVEGDTNFVIEEKTYTLKPYDMIVLRKKEMHRVFHNSSCKFHRYVINLNPEFFEKYNCSQYEENFLNTSLGNKISADDVISNGLYDAFMKLNRYSSGSEATDSPVVPAVIIEILHLINNNETYINADIMNKPVGEIIKYLNENFANDISLDKLEQEFFISKHYICRSFKKATGLTPHQYVTKKRMAYIQEIIKTRKTISEAASLAGYNSYASFYRAYTKEYNSPPKGILAK